MSETQDGSASPPAVLRPHLPLSVVVAMSCVAFFMVILDSTIVTVAIPQMRDGLHLSVSEQQWVLSGYLITLGGLLLLSARAGDIYGRKRVFVFGIAVFTIASLVGGLAPNAGTLLASRIVQGAGAAALTPTSLSLITASHADEDERRRALTLWSIMGAAAGTIGVVLGGVLTTYLSWRWVLFVNIPPGVGLLIAAIVTLLPGAAAQRVRLDLSGALSATVGIGALTYGLSQASSDGWGSTTVIASLVIAAVLVVALVVIEMRSSHPLIPPSLLRLRSLSAGNLVMLLMGVTMNATFFFISLYLQQAIGYSPLRTGMALVPVTVILVIGAFATRMLVPRVGARNMLIIGGLVGAVGMAWLVTVPTHSSYGTTVLLPTLVAGLGLSFMLPTVTVVGTNGVAAEDSGAAAGLLNTSRQLGGAIGLAVLTTVAATAATHALRNSSPVSALVHGYHVAFIVNAGVMFAAAVAALALPAVPRPAKETTTQPVTEEPADAPS